MSEGRTGTKLTFYMELCANLIVMSGRNEVFIPDDRAIEGQFAIVWEREKNGLLVRLTRLQ